MSGAGCDDASADRLADQCQVAQYVNQFMACRFVVEYQRFVVDITQVAYVFVGYADFVCQFVKCFLRHFLVVDNNCIVQVTAFDQIVLAEHFHFTNENKCTGSSNFFGKLAQIVHGGELIG